MIVLLSLAFILLAGLVTLPLSKGAGAGRVAVFAVLSILGAGGALLLVHHDVVPDFGGDETSEVEATEEEAETMDGMKTALEGELGLKLVKVPSAAALASDHATVWRFEQGHVLLCAAQDFPASTALDCFVADGTIGAEPLAMDGAPSQ